MDRAQAVHVRVLWGGLIESALVLDDILHDGSAIVRAAAPLIAEGARDDVPAFSQFVWRSTGWQAEHHQAAIESDQIDHRPRDLVEVLLGARLGPLQRDYLLEPVRQRLRRRRVHRGLADESTVGGRVLQGKRRSDGFESDQLGRFDLDLLDEQARQVLGLAGKGEVVVFLK